MMKLYGYWRSSASYRVRIALNLKGVDVEHVPVNLRMTEHRQSAFKDVNPAAAVPVLVLENGQRITQSLAILDYLEDTVKEPSLLPSTATDKAVARSLALLVACDTSPLQNLKVQNFVKSTNPHTEDVGVNWANHWITEGLASLEATLANLPLNGTFLFGDQPGWAECVIIPQLYNAERFGVEVSNYPRLSALQTHCLAHDAFQQAAPENQPDAPAL
ncbi:MAG: maleylacetoacetate isomerase [Pseudomonadota bacterium]